MKTPRDVAIDVVHEVVGKASMTRELLILLIEDRGEMGQNFRKIRDAVEKAIEADRASQRKALAPS